MTPTGTGATLKAMGNQPNPKSPPLGKFLRSLLRPVSRKEYWMTDRGELRRYPPGLGPDSDGPVRRPTGGRVHPIF